MAKNRIKRPILLGVLIGSLFVIQSSFGQDRKLVRRVKGVEYEEFEVLPYNRKIRDGSYLKYKGSIQLGVVVLERGSYKANVKEGTWELYYTIRPYNVLKERGEMVVKQGLWEEYYHIEPPFDSYVNLTTEDLTVDIPQTGIVSARGNFEADKKVGIWEFIYPGGFVYEKYDYSNKKPVPIPELILNDTIDNARYVGGDGRLERLLSNKSFENGILRSNGSKSGAVTVVFTVDAEGFASGFEIGPNENASKLFQKKAIDLIQGVPNEWIPKDANGSPVESFRSIKITISYEQVLSNFSTSKIEFDIR